jgi:hypothetical protein
MVAFLVASSVPALAQHQLKGIITPGKTFSGKLTDSDEQSGNYHKGVFSHHDWLYKGRAGERVVVTLERGYSLIDLRLSVRTPAGESLIAKNENDRKLDVRLPADGEYIVCISAIGEESYNLVLTSAPPEDGTPAVRQLYSNVPLKGEISSADERQDNNTYHQDWNYFGQAGERITVNLAATGTPSTFNPFLALYAPETNGFLGEVHAGETSFVLPEDGTYTMCIHTHGGTPETGTFAVSLQSADVVRDWKSMLDFGQDGKGLGMLGYFTDDKVDTWYFFGSTDEQVQITMRPKRITDSDQDFDTYLRIGQIDSGSFRQLAYDDDGAGGTASRLSLRLPNSGMYVVRASAYEEKSVKAHYDIVLERVPKP